MANTVRHALSVDVEEWFHAHALREAVSQRPPEEWESRVVQTTHELLDLFDEAGTRATFFILGWVAEKQPDLVREIVGRGHEIATHGHSHTRVDHMTPEVFAEELRRAVKICEDITGQRVLGHRAPSFSVTSETPWAFDAMLDLGLTYDSSHRGLHAPHWITTPSGRRIREFPVTCHRLLGRRIHVAGGGFFRLFPLWTTVRLLRAAERRGFPGNFFLHPWEHDAGQPNLRVGRLRHFRHYSRLASVIPKLRTLLRTLPFAPMRDILDEHLPLESETIP
ncbi:DUF3473 domain-containing protein [Candidatus Sumerlaeota bacterium]|nr:DUF3473 domain-containing protein [Candidatus Sumerlaeota bacterium]